MRKLAILTFQTLDGVMQAPKLPDEDLSGGFRHGGWANTCWDEVMAQVRREAMTEDYDLLLGRSTYNTFASVHADSGANNPVAQKLTRAKKYVVTSAHDPLSWQNSKKIAGNIPAEILKLKQQEGPLIQVHGSWQLIQLLLENELIDEYRLWTFPVIVGEGKRVFSNGSPSRRLKLIKSEPCTSGAFMHFYQK